MVNVRYTKAVYAAGKIRRWHKKRWVAVCGKCEYYAAGISKEHATELHRQHEVKVHGDMLKKGLV